MTIDDADPKRSALLPTATGRQVRRFVGRTVRGRWVPLMAAFAAMIVQATAALGIPGAIGWTTQLVADDAGTEALVGPVALLVGCAVVAGVATWVSGALLARVVLPALGELREEVVSASVRLPVGIVEAGGAGDIVSRVSTDVEDVAEVGQGSLGRFLASAITIAVTVVGLAGLDWRFALAALLAVPVQAITVRWYLRVSGPLYAEGRIAFGRRASVLLETFTTLPTTRAYRLGARRSGEVEHASTDAVTFVLRAVRVMTRFYGRLNLAEVIGLSAVIVVAFWLVGAGETTIGAATTAALLFAGLFGPINVALGVLDDVQRAAAALARLVGMVDAAPPEVPGARPSPGQSFSGGGIRFAYADAPVLRGIDLEIAPGHRVAVVGATGSGKSTLASVVAGIRPPDAGHARYGDAAVDAIDPLLRGRLIALVAQETHVFAATVADNLRLAREDATDADLRAALAAVGADRWVDALPDGVDTVVGAGGHALSSVQAQHLAFARVQALDPQIVILDEATAEAGSDAARTLDAAASAVVSGRGALIIAHRLTQASTADEILVMADGAVVERGTHADLLALDGEYGHLWRAWSKTGG
jgi:ATP-binding cassette, subfamily C, bacterial